MQYDYSILALTLIQLNADILFRLRFLDGVADAASQTASLSILIALYPTKVATMLSYFQSLFGLGYMMGKKVLYEKLISCKSFSF